MAKNNETQIKKVNLRKKIGRWAFSGAETCGVIAEKASYVLVGTLITGAVLCFVTDMCQRSINKINKKSK